MIFVAVVIASLFVHFGIASLSVHFGIAFFAASRWMIFVAVVIASLFVHLGIAFFAASGARCVYKRIRRVMGDIATPVDVVTVITVGHGVNSCLLTSFPFPFKDHTAEAIVGVKVCGRKRLIIQWGFCVSFFEPIFDARPFVCLAIRGNYWIAHQVKRKWAAEVLWDIT